MNQVTPPHPPPRLSLRWAQWVRRRYCRPPPHSLRGEWSPRLLDRAAGSARGRSLGFRDERLAARVALNELAQRTIPDDPLPGRDRAHRVADIRQRRFCRAAERGHLIGMGTHGPGPLSRALSDRSATRLRETSVPLAVALVR